MITSGKKRFALAVLIFILGVAALNAQITTDMLGVLLHQQLFSEVPENAFNQVFQNFMRRNYPWQNIFYPDDIREVTTAFTFSVLMNFPPEWEKSSNADPGTQGQPPTTTFTGPSITIVNNTGYTVYNVYISQSTSDSWGADRLGRDETLAKGASVSLSLPYPIDVTNRYDIRLKDSDGDTYTKMNVLVSANSRIVFTFDDYDE